MKPFTKKELIIVSFIFLIVFSVTYSGLLLALRRARDGQRKSDITSLAEALFKYHEEMGFFPPSENGKIKACKGESFEAVKITLVERKMFDTNILFGGLRTCDWGKDSIRDVLDDAYPPYLAALPQDPKSKVGYSYFYLSNTRRFQIFSYLEGGRNEDGYSPGIVKRNLECGVGTCSYGKSFNDFPLDVSIEEYEKQLEENRKSGT